MAKITPKFPYISFSLLIITIIGLIFNIINGREYNKSLIENLRETKLQIEKEVSEREECLVTLETRNHEVADKQKEVVELTEKALALEEIKEKAIIEAKKLREKLDKMEKVEVRNVELKKNNNPALYLLRSSDCLTFH